MGARYADTEYAFVSNWQSSAVPSRVPARHITAGAPRALLASLLFPKLGIRIGTGLVSEIVYSTIGAIILLLIVRLVRTGGRL